MQQIEIKLAHRTFKNEILTVVEKILPKMLREFDLKCLSAII